MATPKGTLWPIEPHTQAKHAILQKYLEAWFPILASTYHHLVYIDGFAGPGEYAGGEPGSPIVALNVASGHIARGVVIPEAVFHFIEHRQDRVEHLERTLERSPYPANLKVEVYPDEFHHRLAAILDDMEESGDPIAPTFAFIDPFGFKGIPMHLVTRLLQHPRTETFINFNINRINQFLEHPDDAIREHMIEAFGTDEVWDLMQGAGKRVAKLRRLYQQQLREAAGARFVRYFSMYDQHNRPIYDLFFAGNNSLGHTRMKEAMWRVDPEGFFRFSDATNPSQTVLFDEVQQHPAQLLDTISDHYRGKNRVMVGDIFTWVNDETAFLERHVRAALRRGEQQDHLSVLPTKTDGKKRKKNTFPPEAIIDFTTGGQQSLF